MKRRREEGVIITPAKLYSSPYGYEYCAWHCRSKGFFLSFFLSAGARVNFPKDLRKAALKDLMLPPLIANNENVKNKQSLGDSPARYAGLLE